MTVRDVLFFDTETTCLPDKNADWKTDYLTYPYIVQLAWKFREKEVSFIIKPDGWEIPEESTKIHGITNEDARMFGVPFSLVIGMFLADCREAGMICGHNIYFDTSIIKANILREFGMDYYNLAEVERALYKGKRIDTMRSAMKWVDARFADGRVKFPNLTELYSRCFPGKTFNAHNALEDTRAVAECLPILIKQGLVELKVREYDAETGKIDFNSSEKAGNGPILNVNEKDDKSIMEKKNVQKNENPEKISLLDCMPELKRAVDLAGDIRNLKRAMMDMVEDFRKQYDAIQVVVNLECYKWDTEDNCCDVSIKI